MKEFYYSRNPEESEAKLNDFLNPSLWGIDEEICKVFGKQRGRLRKTKKLVGDFDLLIGATALHHNLRILTEELHDSG
jgi:predicted nucleic acid-binding protein